MAPTTIDLSTIPLEVLQRELAIRSMPSKERREKVKAKLEELRKDASDAWVDTPHSSFSALRAHVLQTLDEVLPLVR